jgi:hypothetical protein
MKFKKNIIAISMMAIFSTGVMAVENQPQKITEDVVSPQETLNKEDFKKHLEQILNQPKTLIITTPEQYISNLNTTEFVKGLMFETSLVIKFLAEHSDDEITLSSFNREYTINSSCFAEVVGSSGNHFNTILNLTLQTPELKEKYNKGYSFMVDQLERYPIEQEYHDLCKKEKIKAVEYSKSLQKTTS